PNFPKGHLSCDLAVKPDPTDPSGNLYNIIDSAGAVVPPVQVTALVDALTDPAKMGTPSSPCGGALKSGATYPPLVFPSVQGRFMQIALTNGTGGGSGTIPVLGVLRLYIVCWGHQDTDHFPAGATKCDDAASTPNGQATIWGVFGSFSAPNLLFSEGLGTDPLSPKHVVLVK
ncbi:MAG TPA: hypothetical protein VFY10_00975, partial [Dehalococcoidia bacterium]|nr:hypothetical protein [Dehalococcoidia bacterium]